MMRQDGGTAWTQVDPCSGPLARAVARAFQMADLLAAQEGRRLRVLVLSASGYLISLGTVAGTEQAALVAEQLAPLGFERAGTEDQLQHDCDVLLVQAAGSPHGYYTGMLRELPSRWPVDDYQRSLQGGRRNRSEMS